MGQDQEHTETTPDGRAYINVGREPLALAGVAWDALKRATDERGYPRVVVKEGVLMRITDTEFEAHTKDTLLGELMRVAVFYRTTRDGAPVYVNPPLSTRTELLTRLNHAYGDDALRVKRFTSAPWFDSQRNLIQAEGLHEASGTFYRPAPELASMSPVPEEPMPEDVQAALHIIDEAFEGFEFADQASRANAYGQMITPFVREMVGQVMAAAYIAPPDAINTGKTACAEVAYYPARGPIAVRAGDTDEAEMRKEILAALLSGIPEFVVDNIKTRLDSGALAGALTATYWSGRILGQSRNWRGPLDLDFAFTGNGLGMSPELARRTSAIYLSPGETGRGWERTFKRADLKAWLAENRARMTWACLVLIQHWVVLSRDEEQGAPHGPTIHSYGRWSRTVGGILLAAGIQGFMTNYRAFIEDMLQDEGRDEVAEFLEAWHEHAPDALRASELEPLLKPLGVLHPYLPTELRDLRPGQLPGKLATWLRSNRDVQAGDFKLVQVSGKRTKWRVVSA